MPTLKDDLNYGLAAFGIQLPERVSIDACCQSFATKPAQNTAAIVGLSSALFYIAERGHNPKVRDLYDAMVYCSTCLSVGYADIFAKTPVGKLIGTFLMTIGPSLSSKVTDGPQSADPARVQEEILATLKQIAEKLPKSRMA